MPGCPSGAELQRLPPDAANLAGLVESLLGQCRQANETPLFSVARSRSRKSGRKPTYDLIVRQRDRRNGADERTGLVFIATKSTISTSRTLRRGVRDPNPPGHVLLITDQREPLSLGAKGEEYLEELRQRGPGRFRHIDISFGEYAALDVLRAVAGLARSGDLEVELPDGRTRRLSEPEVIASHRRRQRFRSAVVLAEILGGELSEAGARVPSAAGPVG